MRINPSLNQKDATYKVVLDILKFSPCYNVFLITADVPEIYMQQFCISLRVPNKEFVTPLPRDALVTFLKSLGYKGSLEFVVDMYIDHMHRPWRTFASIINKYVMLNNDIRNSKAYQTYLAISTSIVPPKKARKGTKTTVVLKKKGSITAEKLTSDEGSDDEQEGWLIRRMSTGVVIRDTPNVSKKKTLDETQKLKGIKLLSDVTQLALDTHKAIKASKRNIRTQQQFGGSSEGAGITPEVPDELKGKSIVSSEGAGITPEVLDETKGKTATQVDDDDWGKIEWILTDDEKKTDDDKVYSDDEVHKEETHDDEEMQDDDEEKKDDDKSEVMHLFV
ncbi:hypothetical protein Tco_0599345 [Tanacetum coccineum]